MKSVSTPAETDVGIGEISSSQIQYESWESLDDESREIYEALNIGAAEFNHSVAAAGDVTLEEAEACLTDFIKSSKFDMVIQQSTLDRLRELMSNSGKEKDRSQAAIIIRMVATVLTTHSAYREVRAVIEPDDDMEAPAATMRAFSIGLVWAAGLAAINQFFSPRQPAITVSVYLAQMFGFFMGKCCEIILPKTMFFAQSKFAFTLNPGPWSDKEQALVTIMANVSYTTPLISDIFFMQRLDIFTGVAQTWASNYGYGICMLLSTQLLGFGLAGLCQQFLVYPYKIVWFYVLGQIAMNKALLNQENLPANGWKISRYRFFFIVAAAMFCLYWIPNTMMPTLTFFNWITWIKPTSAVVAIVTGTYYFNLGLNPVATFDYNWIATLDPFITPFFVLVQIVGAVLFWACCVVIPVFFSNTWFTGYLPINSWFAYDNTGQQYQVSRILDSNQRVDRAAYEAYSPIFFSATFALRWCGMLALIPALLVFTWLWYGDFMWPLLKGLFKRSVSPGLRDDFLSRQMRQYKQVPGWWYSIIALVALGLGFAASYGWPTKFPGWAFPLALLLSVFFLIPVGLVAAMTGYSTDLEILFNIIAGAVCEGAPINAYLVKILGKCVLQQSVFISSDMKLGHYMRLPPRVTMAGQVAATVLSSFVCLGIVNYQITGIPGICNTQLQQRWVCSNVASQWTSAVVWGGLGPKSLLSPSSMMSKISLGLVAGVLWPIPWYLARRAWPNSFFRLCHPVVMMIGPILWAPLNFSNVWGALPISFVVGYLIKNRYPLFWNKYNYVFSTALTCGIALSLIAQFFLSNYGVEFPAWWGTTKYMSTCDLNDCRWKTLAKGETFGPTKWH
ncbi:OPT oligopeptide transporter protein-domain-containing protein [Aspergillus venezuelensis]